MRNRPIKVSSLICVWLVIVLLTPYSICGQEQNTADRGSSSEINRESKPLFVSFLGSVDWGQFQNQLGDVFSDYSSITLGLGAGYRGAFAELNGVLTGGSHLTDDYLGVWDFDKADTSSIGHANISLLLGYTVYRIGRFRVSPFTGIKWNAIRRNDLAEPTPDIGWKPGYQAGLKAEYLIGHTGQANYTERSHHHLFLRLGIGRWVYNDLNLEEGHLLSISVGYQLDVVVMEF